MQDTIEDTTEFATVEMIDDFVKESGIVLDVLPMHENPYRHENDQQTAYHYSCKMMNSEAKWFIVYFSKGSGLRLWISPPEEFESFGKPLHVPRVNIGTRYDGPLPPFEGDNAEYEQNIFSKCSVPAPPNISEILNCLANDSFTIESTGIFESWCVLMKGDVDSIHARKTYDVCCRHRLQLQALLGSEMYHHLVHEMGRTIQELKEESTE